MRNSCLMLLTSRYARKTAHHNNSRQLPQNNSEVPGLTPAVRKKLPRTTNSITRTRITLASACRCRLEAAEGERNIDRSLARSSRMGFSRWLSDHWRSTTFDKKLFITSAAHVHTLFWGDGERISKA